MYKRQGLGAVFVDTALDRGNTDLATVQTVLRPLVLPLADTVIHRNPGFYRVPSPELTLHPSLP